MYLADNQFYPLQNGGENGLKLGRQKRPLLRLNTNPILANPYKKAKIVAVATASLAPFPVLRRCRRPPDRLRAHAGCGTSDTVTYRTGAGGIHGTSGAAPTQTPTHTYGMAAWRRRRGNDSEDVAGAALPTAPTRARACY